MKVKLMALWRKLVPEPVDTSPAQFDAWFQNKLGQELKGGDVYFGIKQTIGKRLPNLNKKFQVFKELENAERMRKELQRDNPDVTLEIVVVRVFYSFPEV